MSELVERLRARVSIEAACGNLTKHRSNYVRLMADSADRIQELEAALRDALDAMEPSGACNGNGIVYRKGIHVLNPSARSE